MPAVHNEVILIGFSANRCDYTFAQLHSYAAIIHNLL